MQCGDKYEKPENQIHSKSTLGHIMAYCLLVLGQSYDCHCASDVSNMCLLQIRTKHNNAWCNLCAYCFDILYWGDYTLCSKYLLLVTKLFTQKLHMQSVMQQPYQNVFEVQDTTVNSPIQVAPNPKTKMCLVSSCGCLCPIHWNQVLSREWRCSWSSGDRHFSNYIWVIKNCIAYFGASWIRGFTVYQMTCLSSGMTNLENSLFLLWSHNILLENM